MRYSSGLQGKDVVARCGSWYAGGLTRRQREPVVAVDALGVCALSNVGAAGRVDWVHAVDVWGRIVTLGLTVLGAVAVYFGVLLLAGVQLRQFVRK